MDISIPIQLKNYNRRADKSVSFKVDSEIEISSDDISKIDKLVGSIGVLVVSDKGSYSMTDKEVQKLLKDMPKYDTLEIKSPSKRYRGILYRVLERRLKRQPTNDEFIKYYDERYEDLCQKGINFLNDDEF